MSFPCRPDLILVQLCVTTFRLSRTVSCHNYEEILMIGLFGRTLHVYVIVSEFLSSSECMHLVHRDKRKLIHQATLSGFYRIQLDCMAPASNYKSVILFVTNLLLTVTGGGIIYIIYRCWFCPLDASVGQGQPRWE